MISLYEFTTGRKCPSNRILTLSFYSGDVSRFPFFPRTKFYDASFGERHYFQENPEGWDCGKVAHCKMSIAELFGFKRMTEKRFEALCGAVPFVFEKSSIENGKALLHPDDIRLFKMKVRDSLKIIR